MELPKVMIDRKWWDRGRGQGNGRFLKGWMYCVSGAVLLALGLPREVIEEEIDPKIRMFDGQNKELIDLFFKPDDADGLPGNLQRWVIEMEEVNDDGTLTNEERERRVKEGLEAKGFEAEFIG
ncbi:MAG: hypothetical protein MOB07_07500 [Acidobacteria bacterium]|nr:hypothetical protein [Acidobacteriota bacterium]